MWGDMNEDDDDGFGGSASANNGSTSPSSSTTLPKKKTAATVGSRTFSGGSGSASTPFDDGSEPDFAGWLAAQAQKKSGIAGSGGKTLPKGLAKTSSTKSATTSTATTAKKTLPISKKPAPAKKLDLVPKETEDDEGDGWGDGW
jgi:SCY1-like protein 1